MEENGSDTRSADGPNERADRPNASSNMRTIAVAATAIALIAISIPFVWQPHEDAPLAAARRTAARAWRMRNRRTGISS